MELDLKEVLSPSLLNGPLLLLNNLGFLSSRDPAEIVDFSNSLMGDCGGDGQLPGSERTGDVAFGSVKCLLARRDLTGDALLDGQPFAAPVTKKPVGDIRSSPPEGI